ncbi:MAG: hypothetical protein ABI761_05800 [Saprospiraceae bacterium]
MPPPFEYGKVHLYDELKHLALRQQLDDAQNARPIIIANCKTISNQIDITLNNAAINRDTLFTKSSINRYFGVLSHLRKEGLFGQILAFILRLLSFKFITKYL